MKGGDDPVHSAMYREHPGGCSRSCRGTRVAVPRIIGWTRVAAAVCPPGAGKSGGAIAATPGFGCAKLCCGVVREGGGGAWSAGYASFSPSSPTATFEVDGLLPIDPCSFFKKASGMLPCHVGWGSWLSRLLSFPCLRASCSCSSTTLLQDESRFIHLVK